MATKSEDLFDAYCSLRGYASTPIPAGSAYGQTSDRFVDTPAGRVVVEVKELSANDDDVRQIRELREQQWTHGGGTPGARVFEHIRRAARQLKRYSALDVPCLLVLYDNIVSDGQRLGSAHLSSAFIDFGMYGLQTVLMATSGHGGLVSTGSGRGPRRQMSRDHRTYVSALQVLHESVETGEPFLLTYHNYFARRPLPLQVFRGPLDYHFVKLAHPNESPQVWNVATASPPCERRPPDARQDE